MEESTANIKPKPSPSLDTVEKTTIKLLRKGYTPNQISTLLGLPLAPIIAELSYKKILNPDARFRS